jgi:hypothetical protein
MSDAQICSYYSQLESGALTLSNERVWEILSKMPGQKGTIYDVIAFIAGGVLLPAADGNKLSAPIIRALSEGASSGRLDDSEDFFNTLTGQPNTVYRWLAAPKAAKVKAATWKERYAELEARYKELQLKYECACNTIDRLDTVDLLELATEVFPNNVE